MFKSQEVFRFKYHKNYDIAEIKNKILKLEEEWMFDTSRQELFDVHKETTTVFLTDYDLDWELHKPYAGTIREPESELYRLVEPIIKDLEKLHNGRVGRVIFPKLKAGKKIDAHVDSGDYLNVSRRHHIPIITNSNVFFLIDMYIFLHTFFLLTNLSILHINSSALLQGKFSINSILQLM
jgi:hypothetical protein